MRDERAHTVRAIAEIVRVQVPDERRPNRGLTPTRSAAIDAVERVGKRDPSNRQRAHSSETSANIASMIVSGCSTLGVVRSCPSGSQVACIP